MAWLPKSRTARKRLYVVATSGAVLIVAAVLAAVGLGDAGSFFYTPSQAAQKHPPAGRVIQLGGFVQPGSLRKAFNGDVSFAVVDCTRAQTEVAYHGELPDLFREGQGVVAKGAFRTDGGFTASQVLAKHDERYMPREVKKTLKQSGQLRSGQGSMESIAQACGPQTAGEAAAPVGTKS